MRTPQTSLCSNSYMQTSDHRRDCTISRQVKSIGDSSFKCQMDTFKYQIQDPVLGLQKYCFCETTNDDPEVDDDRVKAACCEEVAKTGAPVAGGGMVQTIDASFGVAYGFDRWSGSTCIAKRSEFYSICTGWSIGIPGIDVMMEEAIYRDFSKIAGKSTTCSIAVTPPWFFGIEGGRIVNGHGGDPFSHCLNNEEIGISFANGFGVLGGPVEVNFNECDTTLVGELKTFEVNCDAHQGKDGLVRSMSRTCERCKEDRKCRTNPLKKMEACQDR